MADRLQIKFGSTPLEQTFQTLAKQVHDHNVEHAAIFELFITYKVEEGHKGLASHLVNQFGLPEQHNMALTFDCFFLKNIDSIRIKHSQLTTLAARYSPDFFFSTIKIGLSKQKFYL